MHILCISPLHFPSKALHLMCKFSCQVLKCKIFCRSKWQICHICHLKIKVPKRFFHTFGKFYKCKTFCLYYLLCICLLFIWQQRFGGLTPQMFENSFQSVVFVLLTYCVVNILINISPAKSRIYCTTTTGHLFKLHYFLMYLHDIM